MTDDGRFVVVEGDFDGDIGEGIFALGDRFDAVVEETAVVAGDAVDGLEDRIDRPIPNPSIGDRLPFMGDGNGRTGYATGRVHQLQGDQLVGFLDVGHLRGDQRTDVIVVNLFFLVGQFFETLKSTVELFVTRGKTEFGKFVFEGGTPRVLAQHQRIVQIQSDLFRAEDFVGELVFEDTVLVDPALMGKSVFAHDGLVGLRLDTGDGGDQAAGGIDLTGVDLRMQVTVIVGADIECHDHLFEGGIAGTFPQSVDGALDLAGPLVHRFEGVGDGQTQVVVVVHRDDGASGHMINEFSDPNSYFIGHEDADGIGDVDRPGSRFDSGGDNLLHEAHVAPSGIFEAELHILDKGTGVGDGIDGTADHFVGGHLELVLHVDGAGGDEGVDATLGGFGDGITGGFDVALESTSEGADARLGDPLGDLVDRVEVSGAGSGEACFDHIDAEAFELGGDLDLLFGVHGGARALLSVAQGGIKNDDFIWVHGGYLW